MDITILINIIQVQQVQYKGYDYLQLNSHDKGFSSGLCRFRCGQLGRWSDLGEGAKIVSAACRLNLLQEVVGKMELAGGMTIARSVDVSDAAAVSRLVSDTLAEYGRLNIVVNNAMKM